MKGLIGIIALLVVSTSFGQNRINYSQYMHNHQAFNPAFIEDNSEIGGSVLYRNQWNMIQGSPANFVADVFANFGNSNLDIQFLYDEITIFKHIEAGASYSYAIRLGMGTRMSLGLKASYNQQTVNYDQLQNLEAGDPNLSGIVKKQGLNLGAGLFVRNNKWHVGLGMPYIFNNGNIEASTNLYNDVSYSHVFITGGGRVVGNTDMQFYPTTMIKWTKGSPLNMSLDMNFLFQERFWTSAGYRTDNTLILSAGLYLWNSFKIVYSYDLGLGKVNKYGGMTHEISMGYGMEMFKNSFTQRKFVKRKGGRKRVKRSRWK